MSQPLTASTSTGNYKGQARLIIFEDYRHLPSKQAMKGHLVQLVLLTWHGASWATPFAESGMM